MVTERKALGKRNNYARGDYISPLCIYIVDLLATKMKDIEIKIIGVLPLNKAQNGLNNNRFWHILHTLNDNGR